MQELFVRVATLVTLMVFWGTDHLIAPIAGQSAMGFFKPGVLDKCCVAGMEWSNASGRCSGYPGPVDGVDAESQGACVSVVSVCCLKQVQLNMCEAGKANALESMLCAVRDSDPGAEQYRECCHCCQMGLAARRLSASCQAPGLGQPCDSKFSECCLGRPSANVTIPVLSNHTDTVDPADEPDDDDDDDGVDECSLFPGDVCTHLCIDLPGGFRCDCPAGFRLNDDQRTCDILDGNGELNCQTNNTCEQQCSTRGTGEAECRCFDGYRLNDDSRSCTDIDECEERTFRCSSNQQCVNTEGGYTCLAADCPRGSTRNPRTGQCVVDNTCLAGFAFSSISRRCEDIDECATGRHSCHLRYETCRNLNGSYTCDCRQGLARNRTGRPCEDVNECALGYDNCKVGERCENTVGSFSCRRIHHCGTGYTLDEASQTCIDNDECVLGTHNCGEGFVCQNLQGSFRCAPKECPQGYRFNAVSGDCRQIVCRRGMRVNRQGVCADIDECTEGTHRCLRHQQCINTLGYYRCRSLVNCPPGYEPTDNSGCQDINECTSTTHPHRCSSDQECVNRQGSYFCQCPRGLRHDSSGRCVDVNECGYGAAICPTTARCVNTVGSYKCECKEGLISDESGGCLDIDECISDNICQHKCRNVQGSYFCTCNRGYQLRENKRSCEDVDECIQFRGIGGRGGVCGGRCINTPGSYRCECPDGWRLKRDGRSCDDINECQENRAFCSQQDSICINTRGSYKCPVVRCPEGFAKTTATGNQNRGFVAERDGIVCGRMDCDRDAATSECLRNRTKTVAFQFLSLPAMEFVASPLVLLHIKTMAYTIFPNLRLYILTGNEQGLFDTTVKGDRAALRLIQPVVGPKDLEVTLSLENRDFSGRVLISRHITHVHIYVSEYHL